MTIVGQSQHPNRKASRHVFKPIEPSVIFELNLSALCDAASGRVESGVRYLRSGVGAVTCQFYSQYEGSSGPSTCTFLTLATVANDPDTAERACEDIVGVRPELAACSVQLILDNAPTT